MSDKIFICRCEDLTKEEIDQAIDEGYKTLEELKCKLRLGMGSCQGRGCLLLARRLLCQKTGKSTEEITVPPSRSPFIPVSIGTLASDKDE
ncbi:MAG: (2Fe-2S)-binding protein [Thermoplasmatales archaeon]|nr:MAG: (2Fe-2S)-binding protein [Thermoplasmatales archaeon]